MFSQEGRDAELNSVSVNSFTLQGQFTQLKNTMSKIKYNFMELCLCFSQHWEFTFSLVALVIHTWTKRSLYQYVA